MLCAFLKNGLHHWKSNYDICTKEIYIRNESFSMKKIAYKCLLHRSLYTVIHPSGICMYIYCLSQGCSTKNKYITNNNILYKVYVKLNPCHSQQTTHCNRTKRTYIWLMFVHTEMIVQLAWLQEDWLRVRGFSSDLPPTT